MQLPALDVQRGTALLAGIVDARAQLPQGVDEHPYGPVAHALAAVDDHIAALAGSQVGREKPHGRARSAHVDHSGIGAGQCVLHGRSVVALGQAMHPATAAAQRIDDEHAVAHALGSGQVDLARDARRCSEFNIHVPLYFAFYPQS